MLHGVGMDVQQGTRLVERILVEHLNSLRADQFKIASIIKSRTNFTDDTELNELFLKAATKDPDFAKDRGIIDDICEAQIPSGAPILQLVFKR